MAPTTPGTASTGQVMTAAFWNAQVRDNLDAAMGVGKASCALFRSAVLSVATATATSITWDSEYFDHQTLHSTSVNTERITVPTGWGGIWMVGGHVQFAANATGQRTVEIWNASSAIIATATVNATAAGVCSVPISVLWAASAADTFRLVVTQNSGGNLNVNSGQLSTFWAYWVSM